MSARDPVVCPHARTARKSRPYGIQGRAALFIEEIRGDYFNIVGLPVRRVYELSQRI
jgi:septum formation protein